jgi:cytochrome c-type biogenesis protein CcmH
MLLWIIFAALTAALLAVILRPLAAASRHEGGEEALAVYRDQLQELDREEARGVIASAEAQAARSEIGRRLLKADDSRNTVPPSDAPYLRRKVLMASVLAVPLLALSFYLAQGSPGIPGLPYAQRMANAEANRDMDALIVKVERHLADHPQDAQGWRVLAPAYRARGRYDASARAYREALARGKPDADLLADLGEVTVLAAQGVVTRAAAESFDAALRLDPKNAKARYFHALALLQDGNREAAVAEWRRMLTEAPADAPWRAFLESQIAGAAPRDQAPGPTADDIAAAERMSDSERKAMVTAMVEGLSQRLAENGSDLDGWLRLARARVVLGEPAKAAEALARAREIFGNDATAIARIEDLRKELRLP